MKTGPTIVVMTIDTAITMSIKYQEISTCTLIVQSGLADRTGDSQVSQGAARSFFFWPLPTLSVDSPLGSEISSTFFSELQSCLQNMMATRSRAVRSLQAKPADEKQSKNAGSEPTKEIQTTAISLCLPVVV